MYFSWACCIIFAAIHIFFKLDGATAYIAASFVLGGLITKERKNGR